MSRRCVSESKLLALVICYDVAQINGINPTLTQPLLFRLVNTQFYVKTLARSLSFYIYICCAISIWPILNVINEYGMEVIP